MVVRERMEWSGLLAVTGVLLCLHPHFGSTGGMKTSDIRLIQSFSGPAGQQTMVEAPGRRFFPRALKLRGGKPDSLQEEESVVEEFEPDWLNDPLEAESSWDKPDQFDKMLAGKNREVDDHFTMQSKEVLRSGGSDAGESEGSSASDAGKNEDSQAEVEEMAYIEHNGHKLPLGNKRKDVDFLRRLTKVWSAQGLSMKVMVPEHLRAEVEKEVNLSALFWGHMRVSGNGRGEPTSRS
jgi:hypothetical protein